MLLVQCKKNDYKYCVIVFFSIFCVGLTMTAHGKRHNASKSLASTFDEFIKQLDDNSGGQHQTRKQTTINKKENGDINNYIQSMVSSLDSRSGQTLAIEKKQQVVKNDTFFEKRGMPGIDNITDASDKDFYQALDKFKRTADFGQLALQQVIDLLDAELNLVRHLIVGHTGIVMESARNTRNKVLRHTIPAAVDVYDTILAVSTYDNAHNEKLNKRVNSGKHLLKSLTVYDQKMFLSTIENKIERYQTIIKDLQYNTTNKADITLGFNPVGHMVGEYLSNL